MFKALSLFLSILLLFGCTADIVPATGEKRYLGYTWQQETEIGKQASQQVAALFGLYRDPKLERYVMEVGNRVLATSHLRRPGTEEQFRKTPVTFGILDSPIINAMALPGPPDGMPRPCRQGRRVRLAAVRLSGGRALIFPGEEDFGMIAVEAHACGRPVIALARGGALEIVIPELNGIFFAEETASSLAEAVVRFESIEAKFQPRIIQETARPFREARFEREIRNFIFEKYQEHCDHFKVGRREYEPHF